MIQVGNAAAAAVASSLSEDPQIQSSHLLICRTTLLTLLTSPSKTRSAN